jgi:hypothetical protein
MAQANPIRTHGIIVPFPSIIRIERPFAAAWVGLALIVATVTQPVAAADVSAEQARNAIRRAVQFLSNAQDDRTGRWNPNPGFPGGVTALCTLALLNSGVPVDDPRIVKAMATIRAAKDEADRRTYTVSLETMVLCAAEPEKDRLQIRANVTWLQRNQVPEGPMSGAWSYSKIGKIRSTTAGDPSNTQFAMLALYEAERVGIQVQDTIWRKSLGYWTRLQQPDGSWRYRGNDASSGSITCAGIASTIIALGQVTEGDARLRDGNVLCCQPQSDQSIPGRGLDWLSEHFSVTNNPMTGSMRGVRFSQSYYFYYLYGVERVGRMTANRFIGPFDWYREGTAALLKSQEPSGAWSGVNVESTKEIATSLALLFLSKGRRPVVAAKYRPGEGTDWNRHRRDLSHLTRHVEQRWKQNLTWQVIDGAVATIEDLMQTPVLYICGRDAFVLRDEQKLLLKQYINQGGFIFAESCCEGESFANDFRALMEELFPDSPMRLLPQDHPIWYAEQKVRPDLQRPLYGVDACCRTSIVFCPGELSCYWELAKPRSNQDIPPEVSNEVEAALAIGANVLTYATNRNLREKLDAPQFVNADIVDDPNARATLYVAKIQHNGGSDDAPAALSNLLDLAAQQLQLRVSREKRLMGLAAENLYDYPIAFVHGRRDFRWSTAEREALAKFVKRGGFVMADSICASQAFTDAFRREMRATFPDHRLTVLTPDHPIFSDQYQGFDLSTVKLRNPQRRTVSDEPLRAFVEEVPPTLEAIEVDGRIAVIFSPYDLSCALENQASIECRGYVREDAAKIGINCLLYAMGN